MPLAEVFERVAGPDAAVGFTAFDGSRPGPGDSPEVTITVKTPVAVSYLAQAPGALGLARAYVSGHLDVDGDMYTALARLASAQRLGACPARAARRAAELGGPRLLLRAGPAAAAGGPGQPPVAVGPPALQAAATPRAISHHYDVSNTFYEWVLGPSMAYTCACYPRADATLEQAQEHKFDLVARKIGLKPGMRLLDVGCGWGGMVMHAARKYGVQALGVTLSEQQAAWAQQAIKEAACQTSPRSGTWTTARSARRASTRSARSG